MIKMLMQCEKNDELKEIVEEVWTRNYLFLKM